MHIIIDDPAILCPICASGLEIEIVEWETETGIVTDFHLRHQGEDILDRPCQWTYDELLNLILQTRNWLRINYRHED